MSQDRCTGCGRSSSEVTRVTPTRLHGSGEPVVVCAGCIEACGQIIADAPTRIPGTARSCAFCGKPEEEVAVLVPLGPKLAPGPRPHPPRLICDECVDGLRTSLA